MTQTSEPETEDLFTDAPAALPPVICDRSTLERYANCPAQAVMVERRIASNGSQPAQVGSAVHEILSDAVKLRIDGGRPNELRDLIQDLATKSRPDIQPEVMAACRRTYPIVDLICRHENGEERNADDIIRHDGGKGAQSGQLAFDILPATDERGPIRMTGELDLLLATESDKEARIVDYKSGWKHWTAGDVARSFQFQFYAYLVLANYPSLQRVMVQVFLVRDGTAVSEVAFDRSQMYPIGQRIQSAVKLYLFWRGTDNTEIVDAWPEPAKCAICPASINCRLAHEPEAEFSRNPDAMLAKLVVMTAAKKRIEGYLSEIVRKGIERVRDPGDIVCGKTAFGVEKPAKSRAKPCGVYQIGAPASDE